MKVLEPGSNCMGIYEAGETGLIVDACDYYRTVYHTARKARRYILLAGWQFDTEVRLLRGKDAEEAVGDVRLLHFLEHLCNASPELEIYILAWDFSVIFSMEREWFQDILFNWTTNERIHFRFDNKHALGATHHQKLVIVDGVIAFVGGMDICSARWDDRNHQLEHQERKDADDNPYGAYHDIQSYHTGPVVKELLALFEQRWLDSGAEALLLPAVHEQILLDTSQMLPMATGRVAVSRTQALNLPLHQEIQEIRRLFITAIASAEQLIYLENQYFSSQAIYWALVDRMTEPERPRLQIIMILPDRLPFTEELFLGVRQMKMLRSLKEIAAKNGHAIGAYSTACIKQGERKMTFIHSKLLLVDDRFLSIGSANITNRSMGLDTELNVSWEAEPGAETELVVSIRQVRASLLAEHAGMYGEGAEQGFEEVEGLIHQLDLLADDPDSKICCYSPDASFENSGWPEALEPIARVVDPEENTYKSITKNKANGFLKGIQILTQWITGT